MTVVVDLNIPVPADTDNYNLVLDLNSMKNGILEALNDVIVELGQRPETGSAASFLSVTCTSTGVFGGSVTVNSLNGGSPLVLSNSNTQFGLTRGDREFIHNGTKWMTDSPIQIANGVDSSDAVNQLYITNFLNNEVIPRDAAVMAHSVGVDNRKVDRFNNQQDTAPKADVARYAESAGSAGSATNAAYATNAGTADTATLALNSNKLAGRTLRSGETGVYLLQGQETTTITVNFANLGYKPSFFFTVLGETGMQSIIGSVKTLTNSSASITLFNRNAKTEEHFSICWMAI
jgi:hypothetical protein